jgi:diguanylate cyclase (GGDEF)-like protein
MRELLSDRNVLGLLLAMPASAGLLWLGAALGLARPAGWTRLSAPFAVAAIVLIALCVWWPALALPSDGSLSARPTLLAALSMALAVLVAGGARLAAMLAGTPGARGHAAGALLGTWLLVSLHALAVAPGTYASFGAWTALTSGAQTFVLAFGLVAMQLDPLPRRVPAWSRTAAALAAAAMLTLGPLLSAPGGAAVVDWPQALTVLGIVALAALLLAALKDVPQRTEAVEPALRSAPAVDGLTKLPTRVQFEEQLAAQVAQCDRTKQRLALLFVDLDGFKPVNDTFGHSSGDVVLKQVGERLKSVLRSGDMVGRIGGDEFVLMVTGNPTQEAVAEVARRVIESISRGYEIEGRDVGISCSIGIVFYPDSGAHSKLIARADAAMYAAKRSGGSSFAFFAPSMDEDARDKFEMIRDLRQAVDHGEMELFYQPKIDARTGKVTAAEALLRWKHPTRGMVPPDVFIPLAERFGLIGALGDWVIDDACRQARVWREHGLRMRLAINLSALQMRQDDIVQRIEDALERYRIHPSLLTCEITETVAMQDTKATQATFRRLGTAGIHLSIDDFGTGYSSLSYLRRLPAEELKIDRSFVMDVETSPDARAVVDAVIKLAHALGLRVVAEGVENPRQQEVLAAMGCDEMQGYLFAKPMSARALLLWAIDDRSESTAFSSSLFGTTEAVDPDAMITPVAPQMRRAALEAQGWPSLLEDREAA